MLGLYLHIPFCQAICSYCNFNRGLLDDALKRRYVAALEREIVGVGDGRAVDSIFFGGGTPSLLDPAEIGRLLAASRRTFDVTADAEITLETNPETASAERLAAFRDAGINRISFGVQSFDDEELKRLGRIHSAARAEDAIRAAQATGFASVSFDLMLWLPGQSRASWQRTVERAIALAPDHLSLYLLELYPNAPLKEASVRAGLSQTPDDDAADMYLDGLAALDVAGFEQYEISNVARPGHASRHNLKYWTGGSWLGLGCGAHSTVDGARWKNVAATGDYCGLIEAGQSTRLDVQTLTPAARRQEALFLGLRLSAGLDRAAFAAEFGDDPWQSNVQTLEPAEEAGLVWVSPERVGLTRAGMLLANEILADFV